MNIRLFIYKAQQREFLSYLDLMNSALKRHEKKLKKWLREREAKISTEEEQANFDALIEEEAESLRAYHDLIFESFIIWLYGYLEKELNNLCGRLKKKRSLGLQLSDIAGKGIRRANTFLKKVCGLNLPKEALWEKLIYLREVRNTIVHNGGIIKNEKLRIFVDKQDKEEIFYLSNGKIVLSKAYCEKTVDAVFEYLQELA